MFDYQVKKNLDTDSPPRIQLVQVSVFNAPEFALLLAHGAAQNLQLFSHRLGAFLVCLLKP